VVSGELAVGIFLKYFSAMTFINSALQDGEMEKHFLTKKGRDP
jgi:hypothetical protein